MTIQERRSYGEDAVFYNRKRDCWVAQMNKTVDGIQYRPSASGKTPEEAIKKLAAKKRILLSECGLQKQSKTTFHQELVKMMKTIQGTVDDKTYNEYEYRVQLLETTTFYEKPLSSFNISIVQLGINEICTRKQLSESVCAKLIAFVKRVFEFAIENRDISFNPIKKKNCIKMPKNAKPEESVLPLNSDDLDALLLEFSYIAAIRPIVEQLYDAGIKTEEIIALEWKDIDFCTASIGITQAMRRTRQSNMIDGKANYWYEWGVRETKNPRNIPMSYEMKESLVEWKCRRSSRYVFSQPDGTPHPYDSFTIMLESGVRLQPIILCMLYGGFRIAEVLAFKWEDFDFRKNRVKVRRAVKRCENRMRVEGDGQPKYYFRLGPPKTRASNRVVPMSKNLKSCLIEWKQLQGKYAQDLSGEDLVFPKANGLLQDYDSFNSVYTNYLKRASLEPEIYHTRVFRHTFASWLIVKVHIEAKTLQKLLGHTDIATTLKYYVDTDVESTEAAVFAMDSIVDNLSMFSFRNAV